MTTDLDVALKLKPLVRPFSGAAKDFDPLLELIGDARCVLLGEASHGTHEFYRQRAQLTKRLIVEYGFSAVAAEADFPDAYRINRYVRGLGDDPDGSEALRDFRRFPAWMWRNADVLDFVGWLRDHNDSRQGHERVGFYGLDLYSLRSSMTAVIDHLERVDPSAAKRARERYACFDRFGEDPQEYGYKTDLGLSANCEREVVAQLVELRNRSHEALAKAGFAAADERFQAEQNARVVKNAEEYYRAMFRGSVQSWNLRDRHMADTLDALLDHPPGRAPRPKIVVWAHNSHITDARATELAADGELSLGQLARERHPGATRLIGFSTYEGTVTAASEWGRPAARQRVRPALAGSYEALFHRLDLPGFLLTMRDLDPEAQALLTKPRLQRAIGVVYQPERERQAHYYHASLGDELDAIIHIDHTRALEPLEPAAPTARGESPETYPTGL